MRDCMSIISSEHICMDEELYSRVLGNIDDLLLMFINKNPEHFVNEGNNLRVGLLQLICLEKLSKDNFKSEYGLHIKKPF